MRLRYLVVPVLLACAIFLTAITASSGETVQRAKRHHKNPVPVTCTVQGLRPFSAKVWDSSKWERGMPSKSVTSAYSRRLGCAPPAHKKAMKRTWQRDKAAYFKYRGYRHRDRYYGCTTASGCRWYAIPASVVECESGGRYNDPNAPNGAYSLLDEIHQGVPTWETYRPNSSVASPWEATPEEQDKAAFKLVSEQGSSPWECW